MIFSSILTLLAAGLLFSLGVWVLSNYPNRQVTRLFFIMCLLGAVWSFSLYEFSLPHQDAVVIYQHLGMAWLLIFPVQLHFIYQYAEELRIPFHRLIFIIIYLISVLIFGLLSFQTFGTNWMLLWPFLLAIASQIFAVRAYRAGSADRKKIQELLILLGISIGSAACIGLALNQLFTVEFQFLFPLIITGEALLIAIGLVRHDLIRLTPFTAMESIMSTLTDAVILTTSGGMIVTANRSALEILDYKEVELIDKPIGSVVGQVWKGDFLPGEDDFGIEMALIAKDKTRIPVTLSTSVVAEAIDSPQGIVFVARDLTKRVHAQEQLLIALKEKEILLKETHHRVKNNLQVISSLLSIQTDYVSDIQAKKVLEESRNRVFSMAVVHELLYQSDDLREIDFKDYTDRLIEHIVYSHNVNPEQITFSTNIADVALDLDTASYIGLVINELIVNALTHGFPDNREGKIEVSLSEVEGGNFNLDVSDDGVGLPTDFDLQQSDSLGLQLVSMVAGQIGADLDIEYTEGTTFRLTFHRLDDDDD